MYFYEPLVDFPLEAALLLSPVAVLERPSELLDLPCFGRTPVVVLVEATPIYGLATLRGPFPIEVALC